MGGCFGTASVPACLHPQVISLHLVRRPLRPFTLLLSTCRVHKRGLNNRPLHHHEKEPQLLPFKFRWDRVT